MVQSAFQSRLSRFILFSLMLHALFLLGAGHSHTDPTIRYLGSPMLDIQLPDASAALADPVHVPTKLPHRASGSTSAPERTEPRPSPEAAWQEPDNQIKDTASHSSTSHVRNQILGQLQTNLSRYLAYPPLARQRGWEGTVLLGLRVDSDGHIEGVHVTNSSGYAILDNSALNSLTQISRLAETVVWLNGKGIDMQLPVIYRLIEN
jgi:protein TonB